MTMRDFFKEVGGDYDKVLSRLQGEALIKKFVKKFSDDKTMEYLISSFKEGRIEDAFRAAHTIKGVAANLGLDMLGESAAELTERLRGAENFPEEKYLEKVSEAYEFTVEKIKELE